MPSNGRPRKSPYARRNEAMSLPRFTCPCGEQRFEVVGYGKSMVKVLCTNCGIEHSVGRMLCTMEEAY